MKAFVIKNKEGKYFVNPYCWAEKICNAYIVDDKDSLEKLKELYLLTDCEVVKTTIAEGDLEQELDKAEQELAFYEDEIKNRGTCGLCEKLENEQIKKLEQELAEKDKEIEKLKDKLKRTEKAMHKEVKEHLEYYNADQKQLRKQVCAEIRKKLNDNEHFAFAYLTQKEINKVIDQIEQAKESINNV